VIGLLPALDIFPVAVPILEHRLYLPMAGFVIAAVVGIPAITRRIHRPQIGGPVLVALLAVCCLLSYLRLPVWRNSESLWKDAIEKAPTDSRSYYNLAGYYYDHQHFDQTIEYMKMYINLKPNDPLGYGKLEQTYVADNRFAEAAQVSRARIIFRPASPNGYLETAKLYLKASLPESAIVVCNAGLAAVAFPNRFILDDMLGHVYTQMQNDTLAERYYREALLSYPDYGLSQIGLGVLAARRGDRAGAIASIEAGMKSSRLPEDVVRLLFHLYIETHQNEKADMLRQQYKF
jgi:tetratricopeptide (TPR) repeat protein